MATYDPASSPQLPSPSINSTTSPSDASNLQPPSSPPLASTQVHRKPLPILEVHEKFSVDSAVDNQNSLSPYSDEKEVVVNEQPRSPEKDSVVLNPQDNTGLRLLFDLDDAAVSPTTSPLAAAPSLSSISLISSMPSVPNLHGIPLSNFSQAA